MLTDHETAQLIHDIQREYPTVEVSRWTSPTTGTHVVIVRNSANRDEVRLTSLRSNWRRKISGMLAMRSPRAREQGG